MIDNPLPDQVMAEKDQIHLDRNFEDLCKIHGVEIAKHYKVHPDYMMSLQSGITTTCLRILTCLSMAVSTQMKVAYVTGGQTTVIFMMTSFHLIKGLNSKEICMTEKELSSS